MKHSLRRLGGRIGAVSFACPLLMPVAAEQPDTLFKSFIAPPMAQGFGSAVATVETTVGTPLVVGAPGDEATRGQTSFFFDWKSSQPKVLTSTMPGDNFGYAVAISWERLVVGAPGDDWGAENAGKVYVYDSWSAALLHILVHPNPAVGDRFGH
jgi:hypothetical protein